MRLQFLIYAWAGFALLACQNRGTASFSKDMGTVKTGIDAVAVYYPAQNHRTWLRSGERSIVPGTEVYTINDKQTKEPIHYAVHVAGKPQHKLQLLAVVFKEKSGQKWFKGFVLDDCFVWDKTKDVDDSVKNGAQDVASDKKKGAVEVSIGQAICKI